MKYFGFVLGLMICGQGITWNSMGHLIVACIAQKQLEKDDPAILESVYPVLASLAEFFAETPNSLLESAVMPDYLNFDFSGFLSYYHYKDMPEIYKNDNPQNFKIPNFAYDIKNAMWAAINIIKDSRDPDKQKIARVKNGLMDSLMLRYIIHIVGDSHQPLHASSLFSRVLDNGKFENSDEGATIMSINDIFNRNITNLHGLWDSAVGLYEEIRELPLSEGNRKIIEDQADILTDLYPPSFFSNRLQDTKMETWIEESHKIAADMIYTDIDLFPVITPDHVYRGQTICKQQITLAGYRLAKVLQELYK